MIVSQFTSWMGKERKGREGRRRRGIGWEERMGEREEEGTLAHFSQHCFPHTCPFDPCHSSYAFLDPYGTSCVPVPTP